MTKISTADALVGIAERMLNTWGVNAIKHSISCAAATAPVGGLIVLSSTLFLDDRFIEDKLDALAGACGNQEMHEGGFAPGNDWDFNSLHRHPQTIRAWHFAIKSHPKRDVAAGIVWASQYRSLLGHLADALEPDPPSEIEAAGLYIEGRVPGLREVFARLLMPKKAGSEQGR